MQAKFGPSVKRTETSDIGRDAIVQVSGRRTLFGHKRNEDILDKLQAEAADGEVRRYEPYWLRRGTAAGWQQRCRIADRIGRGDLECLWRDQVRLKGVYRGLAADGWRKSTFIARF